MCGSIICGFGFMFLDVLLIVFSYLMTFFYPESIFSLVLSLHYSLFVYGTIVAVYLLLIVYVGKSMLEIAISISIQKKQMHEIYKNNAVYQKLKSILFILFSNLFLVALFFLLGNYFETYYLKIPCILYVCYIFGLAASFPLPLELGVYNIEATVIKKCILNTSWFCIMYCFFEFRNNLTSLILKYVPGTEAIMLDQIE